MSPDQIKGTRLQWADLTYLRDLRQAQDPGDPVSVEEFSSILIGMASVYRMRLSAVLARHGRLGAGCTEPRCTYQPGAVIFL